MHGLLNGHPPSFSSNNDGPHPATAVVWFIVFQGMQMVQKCILVAMDACLQELKRTTTIDTSELTMEQGIFHAFDKSVRSQLDPDWHRLSPKTKQVSGSCYHHRDSDFSGVFAKDLRLWLGGLNLVTDCGGPDSAEDFVGLPGSV